MAYFPFDQRQQIDLPAALAAEGERAGRPASTGVSTGLRQMGHLRGRIMARVTGTDRARDAPGGGTPPRLQRASLSS